MYLCILHLVDTVLIMANQDIKFIDLFAGIGGIRKGLEQAIINQDDKPVCVFTSEIKPCGKVFDYPSSCYKTSLDEYGTVCIGGFLFDDISITKSKINK